MTFNEDPEYDAFDLNNEMDEFDIEDLIDMELDEVDFDDDYDKI